MSVTDPRRLAAFAVALPLLIAGKGQGATTPVTVALEYAAAPTCPDMATFKHIVLGQLGTSPFQENSAHLVRVNILPVDQTYEGRIEWRDADGTWTGDRVFHSKNDDCPELARAMGFALAVQIRLSATESPEGKTPSEIPPPAPLPPAPEPPPPASKPAAPTPEPDPAVDASKASLVLGLGGGAMLGLAPATIPTGRAFFAWRWTRIALEAAAEATLLPEIVRRADGAGFSHQQALGTIAGCGVLRFADACLVAKAGLLRIRGKDIDVPASPSGVAMQTGLRLSARAPLGNRMYGAAVLEGMVLATQWRVTLDNTQVWSSPWFIASVGLDVGVRLR